MKCTCTLEAALAWPKACYALCEKPAMERQHEIA